MGSSKDNVVNARVPDNLLTVLKRRVEWRKKALGKDHPDVAHTRDSMGLVYSEQSKFDDALREYEEALRIKMAAKALIAYNRGCELLVQFN